MKILSLFLVVLVVGGSTFCLKIRASQNPVIYGDEEIEIDERIPIIILNWTVLDDNPWRYEIWQDTNLLTNKAFESGEGQNNHSIQLELGLGQGTFQFRLQVWDYDNQTATFETTVYHGEPPKTILAFQVPIFPLFLFLVLCIFMIKNKSPSNRQSPFGKAINNNK